MSAVALCVLFWGRIRLGGGEGGGVRLGRRWGGGKTTVARWPKILWDKKIFSFQTT